MKHLKFTYVDIVTGRPVSEAPAANGPKFPSIEGLMYVWARESRYPTQAPEFFGTCPDESDTNVPGVLAVLTQHDWDIAHADELRARIPASVTQRQARLMLHRQGVLAGVDSIIDAMPEPQKTEARIEWEYASAILRSSPLVAAMGAALQLDDAGLDALFVAAAKL